MAVAPVFVASRAELVSRLRLTGVPAGTDGEALVDQGIARARLDIYRRLGESVVATLAGYPHSENPTTQQEVFRGVAEHTEVMLTQVHLYRTMPLLVEEGGLNQPEIWNQEAAFRGTSQRDREDLIARLTSDIEQNFSLLEGSSSYGAEKSVRADAIGPDSTTPTPIRPGETIFDYPT